MEQRLSLLATDFAALYREVAKQHLFTSDNFHIETFQTIFDRMHMEYLHYAGSSTSIPFHREITEHLLQLAAIYLTLPPETSPNSRAFGIYLIFMLYSTQPSIETSPVRIRVSIATLQSYVEDIEETKNRQKNLQLLTGVEKEKEKRIITTQLGRHVTDGERRILLSLYKAGAWHILPYDDISLYLRILLQVHEAEGVPLVISNLTEIKNNNSQKQEQKKGQNQIKNLIIGDVTLSQKLEAYEEMKRRLELDGEFRGS